MATTMTPNAATADPVRMAALLPVTLTTGAPVPVPEEETDRVVGVETVPLLLPPDDPPEDPVGAGPEPLDEAAGIPPP